MRWRAHLWRAAAALAMMGPADHATAQPAERLVTCQLPQAEHDRLMALDFLAFDQDMRGGWRAYASGGCQREAADLIGNYLDKHEQLALPQQGVMRFHVFQLLAGLGAKDEAMRALAQVEDLDRRRNAPASWVAYETATHRFMDNDRAGFDAAVAQLEQIAAAQPPPDRFGSETNLNVLRGMGRCFDKSYGQAYGPCIDREAAIRINREREDWQAAHPQPAPTKR
jgi:hypothetical protein